VVIPYNQQIFKPGDQKVVRLTGEQLSVVLRLLDLKGQERSRSLSQPAKESLKP
jgi:hypothetical protein